MAHAEGNEIGTHFVGHVCDPDPDGVSSWTASDWSRELDQFDRLLARASTDNGIRPPIDLGFGPSEVVGVRTPCLQGNLDALDGVLRARGFRYDASRSSTETAWPQRIDGLWSFPLALIPLAGTHLQTLSMDYNLFVNQTAGQSVGPRDERRIEDAAYRTLLGYFERNYHGPRAPLSVASHFARWNDGAYVRATTRLLEHVCRLPEVRCVSYPELADWLDRVPAPLLRRFSEGRFPRLR
jgi:hypothetical protein